MHQRSESISLPVALAFVDAINSRQSDQIAELMTADHVFIDTEGSSVRGTRALKEAWRGYYRLFPDYAVKIDRAIDRGDIVILLGSSSGSLSEYAQETLNRPDGSPAQDGDFQGSAIWTARIDGDRVSEWRVYPDTDSVRRDLLPDAE